MNTPTQFKAELERAFLLCTEVDKPDRVKIISDMFEKFQAEPLKVVNQVFDSYTKMLSDPYLQYTVKPHDIAAQALMTGIMISCGIQHSEEFREKIQAFAKDHLPDTKKMILFKDAKRRLQNATQT